MTEENNNTIATINKAYNQYNLLQLRLDTSNIIEQAKMYLKSEIEIIKETPTGYERQIIKTGEPKANVKGTAAILNWLQNIVNPQTVQGNFPVDKEGISRKYDDYIAEIQVGLGDLLMINLYNYGIEEDELQGIIDSIMNLLQPFMSRLIGNKERESYGETFKQIESSQIRDKSKFKITQ